MENKYKIKKNVKSAEGTVVACKLASTTTINNRKVITSYKTKIQVPEVQGKDLVAVIKFTEILEKQKGGFRIGFGGKIGRALGAVGAATAAVKEIKNLKNRQGPWLPFQIGDKVTVEYNSAKPKKCRIISLPPDQAGAEEPLEGSIVGQ